MACLPTKKARLMDTLLFLARTLKKTYERLKNDGYKVTDLYKLSDNSDEFFFITDPDGYDIEIIKAK